MGDETIDKAISNLQAETMSEVRGEPVREQKSDEERIWEVIDRVYEEHQLGAEISKSKIHVEVANFKRLHGQCHYNRREANGSIAMGHYVIRVAENIIGEEEHNWKQTVRHEIAHALSVERYGLTNGKGHGDNWKECAHDVGAEPTRCASTNHTEHKYMAECPNCGASWGRHKRSKLIKQPFNYSCRDCDINIVSYDSDSHAPSEPGTCAVESIEWSSKSEWRRMK